MIKSLIYSYKTMLVIMVIYALSMACATFIENAYTTETARMWIYHAGWFVLLHLLMVINGIAILSKNRLFQLNKVGSCLFHISFVVILVGATVTHLWGKEGIMQIREGERSNILYDNTGKVIDMLPLQVGLIDFELKRYPGSHSPSSYTSKVKVYNGASADEFIIGMNRVMNIDGYRFFQSSYHPDEKGTILTVNYDFPGMQITYLGYILLLLGFIIVPFQPASRFRRLYVRMTYLVVICLAFASCKQTHAQVFTASDGHVEKFGEILVQNPETYIESVANWSHKLIYNELQTETYMKKGTKSVFSSMDFYSMTTKMVPVDDAVNSTIKDVFLSDDEDITINYFICILLLLGVILVLFKSGLKHVKLQQRMAIVGLIFTLFSIGETAKAQLPSVSKTHAERFGKLLVQNPQGRIEPMDSWSRKLMRKIHHAETYKGQDANAVFVAMVFYPEISNTLPIIYVKNSEIQKMLGCKGEYVAFNDFFNKNGEYILTENVETASLLPAAKQSKLQKDILSVDEVVNIVYELQQGCYFPLFPNDQVADDRWASPGDDLSHFVGRDSMFVSKITHLYAEELDGALRSNNWSEADKVLEMITTYQTAKNKTIPIDASRIDAELQYNKLNIFGRLFKGYLIIGGILLGLLFYTMFSDNIQTKIFIKLLFGLIGLLWITHTYGFGLRWFIAGYAPWSNSYETMLFVAWSVVLIGLLAGRHNKLLTALCSLLGGILLFVASLNWLNPSITPLVPVLQSYWLMLHVAVIMMGYGFFFVSALIGIMNSVLYTMPKIHKRLSVKQTIEQSTILNEMSMIAGTAFLAIGIFLGAVWANESWGRYWGWDPKETWALITMIVYAFVLHMRFVPQLNNGYWFNTLSMWSILSVLMTYFGVNYYLSGLHAYGTGGNIGSLLPLTGVLAILVVLSIFAYKGFNTKKKQVSVKV